MTVPAQQPTHEGRLGKWLPVVMAVAVVLTLVALLAARAGIVTASRIGSGTSPNWQTYHDPDDLFSVRLPPGWAAHVEFSPASFGDTSGGATVSMETTTFENPLQWAGSAHLDVIAYPIMAAPAHQYYCRIASYAQPFSSMNLSSMVHTGAYRLFTTDTASFQVDVTIPGILVPWHSTPLELTPLPTATPLPASWIATDQTEMQVMLTSFQPTDPQPLSC